MSYADNPTNGQLVFVWESSAVLYATIDRIGIDIPFVEACQTVNIAVAVCNAGVVFKITPDISTPDTKGQVFEWSVWCFGHYHADRIERPHIEQLYTDMEDLDTLMERWYSYDENGELEWWLVKSPNYYVEDYLNPYGIKGDYNV